MADLVKTYPQGITITEVKESEAPSYVTFIDPNDPTNFHVLDVNNLSPANLAVMEAVRTAVDATGKPLYRITGNFTATTARGTAASMLNFRHPVTKETTMVNVSTPEGQARVEELIDLGFLKAGTADIGGASSSADIQIVVDRNNPSDMRSYDLNDPDQRKAFNALGPNWIPTTTPSLADLAAGSGSNLGGGFEAGILKLISNADILAAYADGSVADSTANTINNYLTNEMRLKTTWDAQTGREVTGPGLVVSQTVMAAIDARRALGKSVPTIGATGALDLTAGGGGRVQFDENGKIDFSAFEEDPTYLITGIDLTSSQDFMSGVNRAFNLVAGQIASLGLGSGYAGERGKITSESDTQLNALARTIIQTARAGVKGRIFALDVKNLQQEVDKFKPGFAKTDNAARDQLVTVRNSLAMMYSDAESVIRAPAYYDKATLVEARRLRAKVGQLIAETTAAVAVYDKFITTDPMAEAVRARATATATGGLPRASAGGSD